MAARFKSILCTAISRKFQTKSFSFLMKSWHQDNITQKKIRRTESAASNFNHGDLDFKLPEPFNQVQIIKQNKRECIPSVNPQRVGASCPYLKT